jgi:chorismate mutase
MPGCTNKIVPLHESLEALRREIDRIDDSLLDLIEQRLAASDSVAALKQSEGDGRLKLRPAREAAVLTRLVERADRASPELVTLIWRTLMSYALQAQAPTVMVLWAARDPVALMERTRHHFGPAGEIRWVDRPEDAIEAARSSEAVAVIEGQAFAGFEDARLTVFETLRDADGRPLAVAIGRVAPADIADSGVAAGGRP